MMKRLALLFLFSFPVWAADCHTTHPLSLGSGINCQGAQGVVGSTANNSVSTTVTVGTITGDQVVIMAYFCATTSCASAGPANWLASTSYTKGSSPFGIANGASVIQPTANNPCQLAFVSTTSGTSNNNTTNPEPTWSTSGSACATQTSTVTEVSGLIWTPLFFTFINQSSSAITCSMTFSPKSPFLLQFNNSYFNYVAYCPNWSVNDSGVALSCSVVNSCGFMTVLVSWYTGMGTSVPYFDTDGDVNGNVSGCGTSCSATPATSAALAYTNDLVISLTGSINDNETWVIGGGCSMIDNSSASGVSGNPTAAKAVSSGGATASCAWSYSGAPTGDTIGSMVAAIKSSSSVLVAAGGGGKRRKLDRLEP